MTDSQFSVEKNVIHSVQLFCWDLSVSRLSDYQRFNYLKKEPKTLHSVTWQIQSGNNAFSIEEGCRKDWWRSEEKKIRRWQKYFPLLEAINLFRWLERLGLTAVIVAWFRFQTKDHSGRNKEKFWKQSTIFCRVCIRWIQNRETASRNARCDIFLA